MSAPAPGAGLTALIVASRGGPSLQRTLDAVAFVPRRCVIDPARVLGATGAPQGVEPWTPASAAGWVLLLVEGETLSDGSAGVLDEATRGASPAYRLEVIHRLTLPVLGEDVLLRGSVRIADSQPNQEAVELALGQRISSFEPEGVLCRQHKERWTKLARLAVHGDPAIAHGFQKGTLRPRGRPIDLVG